VLRQKHVDTDRLRSATLRALALRRAPLSARRARCRTGPGRRAASDAAQDREPPAALAAVAAAGMVTPARPGPTRDRRAPRPVSAGRPARVQAPVMVGAAPCRHDAAPPPRSDRRALRPARRPGLPRPAPPMTSLPLSVLPHPLPALCTVAPGLRSRFGVRDRIDNPTLKGCWSAGVWATATTRSTTPCDAVACDLRLTPVVPDPYTPARKFIPATDGDRSPSPGACCP
jgi:hypothetical protein